MIADYKPECNACEETFGVKFSSFERVQAGNSSRNFRAVTHSGEAFFVKFAPPRDVRRIVERMKAISSPLFPRLAFDGKTGDFHDEEFFAQDWIEGGRSVPPDKLTRANIANILESYVEISRTIQAIPQANLRAWDGLVNELDRHSLSSKTIHGDFHYRNFFFRDGKFSACFDLECLRRGLETDDLLRIFVHTLERTPFWNLPKRRATKKNFALMVALSKYPAASWLASIRLYERHKVARRKAKSYSSLFSRVENFIRSRLYRNLERIVVKSQSVSVPRRRNNRTSANCRPWGEKSSRG